MSNPCVVIHFWSTNLSFTECVSCQQVIDASRPGCMASGLIWSNKNLNIKPPSQGKAYHPSCFKCTSCFHEIEGRYFMIKDKPICDDCYKVLDQWLEDYFYRFNS